MSLDGQLEKLSALYAEKSDGELLDMYEQRDGLTELAQQALTKRDAAATAECRRQREQRTRAARPTPSPRIPSLKARCWSICFMMRSRRARRFA